MNEDLISKKLLIKKLNSHLRYFVKQTKLVIAEGKDYTESLAFGRILEIKHLLRLIKKGELDIK